MKGQCFQVFIVCVSRESLVIGAGRKMGRVVFSFLFFWWEICLHFIAWRLTYDQRTSRKTNSI